MSSFPKDTPKNMRTMNMKMRSKIPNIFPIEKAISKLDSIAKVCVNKGSAKEDGEFETFAKHVATQMRKIPLERPLILQNDI